MSMLAEPRQRKRYNLVPRGKPLYEDENRFGTKMLEKMGWSKGQGLGTKEDGSKDFVRVQYKNDVLGLGFKEHDDQWTQHEQNFNGLLKALRNEGNEDCIEKENGKSDNEMPLSRVGFGFHETNVSEASKLKDKISGVSLEERSKQSKARVHYKKFTKGKDLTQYSEKDLANIFGKKANNEQKPGNDIFQQLNNCFEQSKDSESVKNVNDYFEEKLSFKKKDVNRSLASKEEMDTTVNEENFCDDVQKKKLVSKRKIETDNGDQGNSLLEPVKKKSKKSKYNADEKEGISNKSENVDKVIKKEENPKKDDIVEIELPLHSIRKKKNKSKTEMQQSDPSNEISNKKKIKENNSLSDNSAPADLFIVTQETTTSEYKKNKSKKSNEKIEPDNNSDKDAQASNFTNHPNLEDKAKSKDNSSINEVDQTKVSSGSNSLSKTDVNRPILDIEEIQKRCESYNIYPISTFCAEKFRNMRLNCFVGSILPEIEGYGLGPDLQLNVFTNRNDKDRITDLWKCVLNKYSHLEKPKKTYKHYVREVINARKTKKKLPKFSVKSWKRKNAFQIL